MTHADNLAKAVERLRKWLTDSTLFYEEMYEDIHAVIDAHKANETVQRARENSLMEAAIEAAANKAAEVSTCSEHGRNRKHNCIGCHNCGNAYRAIRALTPESIRAEHDREQS